jgi:hypothetical protein
MSGVDRSPTSLQPLGVVGCAVADPRHCVPLRRAFARASACDGITVRLAPDGVEEAHKLLVPLHAAADHCAPSTLSAANSVAVPCLIFVGLVARVRA